MARRNNLGTQPTAASVGQQGRGGLITRGGGRGRGRRIPQDMGLYYGRAGEAYANQNPEAYFRSTVSNLGGLDYSGTPLSEFSDDYVASLMDDYNAAQASAQGLSPVEWLQQTYGAGYGGKRGNVFNQGSLGLGGGALEQAYTNWYSNKSPADFLVGRAMGQGMAPGGGNPGFQRYFQETYVPRMMAEQAGARAANPGISMADLIAGRDLMGEARRQYLVRPNAMRQIGPANLAGRWSWWE